MCLLPNAANDDAQRRHPGSEASPPGEPAVASLAIRDLPDEIPARGGVAALAGMTARAMEGKGLAPL